jgi:hypothetical protein
MHPRIPANPSDDLTTLAPDNAGQSSAKVFLDRSDQEEPAAAEQSDRSESILPIRRPKIVRLGEAGLNVPGGEPRLLGRLFQCVKSSSHAPAIAVEGDGESFYATDGPLIDGYMG